MKFLRTFETQTWFNQWHHLKPDLELLLRCFDRDRSDSEPISVFACHDTGEELECAAARVETYNDSHVRELFGIRFYDTECRSVGIKIDLVPDEGLTGVKSVDDRHYNLTGNRDQFVELIKIIVAKTWAGEERLRRFPVHQVRTQISKFAYLQEDVLDSEAKRRCLRALTPYAPCETNNNDEIRIIGELKGKNEQLVEVQLTKALSDYERLIKKYRSTWQKLANRARDFISAKNKN